MTTDHTDLGNSVRTAPAEASGLAIEQNKQHGLEEEMDAGFTKGPWTAAEDFGGGSGDEVFGYSVTSASGADILYFGADDRPETEANARLIAASPCLYEAAARLTKALTRLSNNMNEFGTITDPEFLDDVWVAQDKLDAALLKAEGK